MSKVVFSFVFIAILALVSTLLFLLNAYVYMRLSVLLPAVPWVRGVFKYAFVFLAIGFIAGRLLERVQYSPLSTFLINAGSIWLGFLLYALLLFLLTDIVLLFFRWWGHVPLEITRYYFSLGVALLTVGICFFAYVHSKQVQVTTLDLPIDKPAGPLKTLNVVSVSDIHLGTLIKNSRIRHIVDRINALNPDIVLLAGDVVDEDLAPVIRYHLADELTRIRARYGVYAITGNHEYIGGAEAAVAYLSQYHIRYLRDQAVKVADSFYLIGREDRTKDRFTGTRRLPLNTIMSGLDRSLPIIMMDHQPVDLGAAVSSGVDYQISGHTHHGQLFPCNLITDRIFEKSWGYLRKGATHFYVSCGVGTWGPPMRLGSYSEIVQTVLHFQ